MSDNNKPSAPGQVAHVEINIGKNPGDIFVACLIPAGTTELQIISDGKKTSIEYCTMMLGGIQGILMQMNEEMTKEKSPILDPFANLRHRHFHKG
jgi:hypothetical protein